MSPTIRIDQEVFESLKKLGEPFVDTPNSVIKRILKKEGLLQPSKPNSKLELNTTMKGNLKSMASYPYPRLCFKAKHIEPLSDDNTFEIVTKEGTFQLTKADFYSVFPNVVKSKSYREEGIYHYPKVPEKALQFKK